MTTLRPAGTLPFEPTQPGPPVADLSFRWATVIGTEPLRILLDGDSKVLPYAPQTLVDPLTLSEGSRVWTQMYGRRVIVLGKGGGQPPPLPPPTLYRSYEVNDGSLTASVWNDIYLDTPDAGRSSGDTSWLEWQGSGVWRLLEAGIYTFTLNVRASGSDAVARILNSTEVEYIVAGRIVFPFERVTLSATLWLPANTDFVSAIYPYAAGHTVLGGPLGTYQAITKLT